MKSTRNLSLDSLEHDRHYSHLDASNSHHMFAQGTRPDLWKGSWSLVIQELGDISAGSEYIHSNTRYRKESLTTLKSCCLNHEGQCEHSVLEKVGFHSVG